MIFSAFFPELDPKQFFESYWPNRFAVGRGPLARLPRAFQHRDLQDEAKLLRSYNGEIQVWSSDGAVVASAEQALAACRAGKAAYLDHAESSFREFIPLVQAFERELDLPPGCAFVNVFISGPNAVVPPHFDYDFGMNLLVKGQKTWTMAPNENVDNPLHSMRMIGAAPSPSLAEYWTGPVPKAMPHNSDRFDVGPGDVVFVPRGVWHATEAAETCIAIDFAVNPPVFADAILHHLRTLLYRDKDWRRSVRRGAPDLSDEELFTMVDRLRKQLRSLDVQELRRLTEQLYQRSP